MQESSSGDGELGDALSLGRGTDSDGFCSGPYIPSLEGSSVHVTEVKQMLTSCTVRRERMRSAPERGRAHFQLWCYSFCMGRQRHDMRSWNARRPLGWSAILMVLAICLIAPLSWAGGMLKL